jgi:hypothetical protein
MEPCAAIRNCHIITFHEDAGVVTSVGIFMKERESFITICQRDECGCQHITTNASGSLLINERISRALRLLGSQDA